MKNIAIKVDNVSKTFAIPHEKISTLRGAFVFPLKAFDIYDNFAIINLLKPPAMTL